MGTMDGANIEICEETGRENHFIFGASVSEIAGLRAKCKTENPDKFVSASLKKVFKAIDQGVFGERGELQSVIAAIREHGDFYLISQDFDDYIRAQYEADVMFRDQQEWTRRSIHVAMNMAKFNSDRTIDEYAKEIWNIEPITIKGPKIIEKNNE